MKELLKLLTVALAISATYAEDVVAKADAKPETTKDAAVAKWGATLPPKLDIALKDGDTKLTNEGELAKEKYKKNKFKSISGC